MVDIDYEDLRFYARAALVSYKTEKEFEKFFDRYKRNQPTILDKYFDEIKTKPKRIRCQDCGFAVAERNDEVLIMFPGTRKERTCFYTDFKTDFDIPIVEATFISGSTFRTHRGFLRRYKLMYQDIWKIVHKYGYQRRYTVVGHSLGAAMAIFLALELKAKGYETLCVTLAAPKIGDQSFVELANKISPRMIRLIRTNDPLPKVAPINTAKPFSHFGEELTIDKPNDVWLAVLCGSIVSFLLLPSILVVVLTFLMMLMGVNSTHSTESYVKLVDNLRNKDQEVPEYGLAQNYPKKSLKCLPQWYPIILLLIFAYSRQLILAGFYFVRRQMRRTIFRHFGESVLPSVVRYKS